MVVKKASFQMPEKQPTLSIHICDMYQLNELGSMNTSEVHFCRNEIIVLGYKQKAVLDDFKKSTKKSLKKTILQE